MLLVQIIGCLKRCGRGDGQVVLTLLREGKDALSCIRGFGQFDKTLQNQFCEKFMAGAAQWTKQKG